MKTKITLAAALAMGVMSFVTSCSNEVVEPATDAVMLEAEVSGIANTRAAIEGTTLPAGSEYGLYVFQDYKAVSGNIKMSANSTSTGYLLTNNSEVKVCAYYPYSEWGIEGEDLMTIYPGTTDYLHTISSDIYTKSNPKASIQLYHALARVKFNVTVATDAPGSYEVYFTELDNVYTKGSMRIGYYDGEVYGAYKSNGRVNVEPIKDYLKAGSLVSTEVLLLPQDLKYEAPKVIFTVDGEQKDISSDIVNATYDCRWESGKVYTYNITINEGARLSVSSCTIEEWGEPETLPEVTIGSEQFNANGHEYVDLGLPSGTLWATCNVGATSPEGYGDYFVWGDPVGHDEEANNSAYWYQWKYYKWCNGDYRSMTKYCVDSYYGTVDNKMTLDPEDDAASVNWGGDWRMPSETEYNELMESCTWTWTTINDVNGYKVSGSNGNWIFLPAAGYRSDSDKRSLGAYGNYWANNFSSYYSEGAYFLSFGDSFKGVYPKCNRCDGYSVRPVLHK